MGLTIKTDGLDSLAQMLAEAANKAQDVASGALFDGAGIVADALNAGINSIQTEPFKYAAKGETRLPSPEEKAALDRKIGIARFRKNGGEVDTLIGLQNAGYANVAGKQKAVAVIARSINSGTSFMKRQPVFRKGKNKAQGAAKDAMVAKAEKMLEEIIKG